MKAAIAKFIASGKDQVFTTKDPIRYWVSIMKLHKDAPKLNQAFFRELETMGSDPYITFQLQNFRGYYFGFKIQYESCLFRYHFGQRIK